MSKQYDAAVIIGRFQPFHNAHYKLLEKAQEIADQVVVVLGGHRCAVTIRDPWSSDERERMVREVFPGAICVAARDHLYNDGLWLTEVQQKVRDAVDDENAKVALVGHYKDRTSYYLKMFPQWAFEEVPSFFKGINATAIRAAYFKDGAVGVGDCPLRVIEYLHAWRDTPTYARLCDEFAFVEKYKASWASAPFPPTFVTVDAVVIGSGHVLVVKRRAMPGKGMIALPGGFIQPHEKIKDAVIRELKEETGIRVPVEQLRSYVADSGVFDHPDRSLRGRTITHAFLIRLPDGDLPAVKGGDDAERAWWMPLGDLYLREPEMFEDHVHIVNWYVNKL
jgi:bifunctional NMN adenylyltransferase/nudix hydrolase